MLLAGSALSAWVDSRWVALVVATAFSSILVGLTGFCFVGKALTRLGFKPGQWYFMQTDSWYLARRIDIAVGFNLTVASVLSLVNSPGWLSFTAFVGAAMV